MKKIFFLVALMLIMAQGWAASVDLMAAQANAQRYLQSVNSVPRINGASVGNVRLLYTEVSAYRPGLADYYIFNSDQGFVIVAGDDRAQEILAHGNRPLDMNRMPDNMRYWLSTYKRQIEFLHAHPSLEVEKPMLRAGEAMHTVQPLLTAEWDQAEPYWNYCPVYGGERCYSGCPATSLSMVFYYWKYPKDPTPEVESYVNLSNGDRLPSLPSITFDWDNMLDVYEGVEYTEAQADALAWLMRYVGQV